jgi:hypothetical protein
MTSVLLHGGLWDDACRLACCFEVTCDGDGVVGHVGAALLVELADRLELAWSGAVP